MYKTGDIFNCTRKSIVSRLIKLFTKSEYSHTAMYIEIWDKPFIIEAQKDGIHLWTYDQWIKRYDYSFEVRRGYIQDEKAFSIKAMSLLGKKYDFKSLLLLQPIELTTGIELKNKKGNMHKLFCSEYVAWCYSIKDFQLTPGELRDWQIEQGFEIVI